MRLLDDLIRRRLEAVLRPWLAAEPEIEVKLGLFRSHAIARNLKLNAHAINLLLDDPGKYCVNELTVDYLGVWVTNWSAPACSFEMRGIRVNLAAGQERDDEGIEWMRRPTDTSKEEFKKIFDEIDSEASALHDMLERIAGITKRDSVGVSVSSFFLKHSYLEIHDFHLQLQFPSADDTLTAFIVAKEFCVQSENFDHSCLLKGIVAATLIPAKESCHAVDCKSFEVRVRSRDHELIFPQTEISSQLKVKNLQVILCEVAVHDLKLSFDPTDISILEAVNAYLPRTRGRCRSGRQIWKLVRSKVLCSASTPMVRLQRLVHKVGLWLLFVNNCKQLLLEVGYPVEILVRESAMRMVRDKKYSSCVKQQWTVISAIKDDLPVEAIVQGLQVARHQASMESALVNNDYSKIQVSGMFILARKVFGFLHAIQNIICICLCWLVSVFRWKRSSVEPSDTGCLKISGDECCSFVGFNLNVEKVSITIFPVDVNALNVNEGLKFHSGISQLELVSFCIVIEALFVRYTKGICEQSSSVFCGTLKIISSVIGAPASRPRKNSISLKLSEKGAGNISVPILESEPALMFHLSERNETADCRSGCSVLQKVIREIWSNWNTSSLLFDYCESSNSEDPFLLFELRKCIVDSSQSSPYFGSIRCGLSLGKLNLTSGFSSMLSIILLHRQIGQALVTKKNRMVALPRSSSYRYPPANYWGNSYNTCIDRVMMAVQKIQANRYIQLGVILSGFCIQVPSELHGGNQEFHHASTKEVDHLALNVQNLEIAVWPSSVSDLKGLNRTLASHDEKLGEKLKEPWKRSIRKEDNAYYEAQGQMPLASYLRISSVICHLQGPSKFQRSQFLSLDPIRLELSAVREHLHSLSSSSFAFSAAMSGVVTGLGVFVYMDELSRLIQLVIGIHSAVLLALTRVKPLNSIQHREVMQPDLMPIDHIIETEMQESLISRTSLFAFNCSLDVRSIDIALHNSRKGNSADASMETVKVLNHFDLPDCGLWASIQQLATEISCEEDNAMISADLCGFQLSTFRYQSPIVKGLSTSELRVHLLKSNNFNYEMDLTRITVTSKLGTPQNGLASEVSTAGDYGYASSSVYEDPLISDGSSSTSQPSVSEQISDSLITINFALSEIFLTPCSLRSRILGAHQSKNFVSSFSLREESETISGSIQGGGIFLDGTALRMLSGCSASYFRFVMHLLSGILFPGIQFEGTEPCTGNSGVPHNSTEENAPQTPYANHDLKSMVEDFVMDLSSFSLMILNESSTGKIQELVFEVDMRLKFSVTRLSRAFMFNLSRMSIFSQFLHLNSEDEVSISQLSSAKSSDFPSEVLPGDFTQEVQLKDQIRPVYDSASCRNRQASLPEDFCLKFQSYILKHFGASISAKKPLEKESGFEHPGQVWMGSGTVSGCDIAISIVEIKMIIYLLESFSEVFNKSTNHGINRSSAHTKQETQGGLGEIVPDGAVVAVQDVQQHLYFAVETSGNKYSLNGVVHYSLVGERALFRVKYHRQRPWSSNNLSFSLVSLYAKNEMGEPLRLNYQPGSGFVSVSSDNDKGWALWNIMAYNPEGFNADRDWEPYNQLTKKNVILVNQKNNCSVAFIEGVPEFVPKPGSPIKFKVFQELPPDCNNQTIVNGYEESQINEPQNAQAVGKTSIQASILPCIDIRFDKIRLTVSYELLDTRDKLPLLQGCVDDIKMVVQLLDSKIRVISSWTVTLAYFNAQRNSWNQLVPLADMYLFYRSNLPHQVPQDASCTVPGHLYFRLKELDIKLSELSLDILLLICGELELAGPFSIKRKTILSNYCKVENQTSVNLLCHFSDHQQVTISRMQSASVCLRQLSLVTEPIKVPSVSIQLAFGDFLTSPISLSLSEDLTIAWRTRLGSRQDTRTNPGPFVVIDISRKSEDGLIILVSPLMKIHNETSYPLELRFQRPQQKEADLATVLLKPGETIDDPLTVFEASNSSGGAKKALAALTVGRFILSFRPQILDCDGDSTEPISSEWSNELKGGKAVRLSGLFDKLRYKVRKAVFVEPEKRSLTTAHCSLNYGDILVPGLHFLIHSTGRDVPIMHPGNLEDKSVIKNSPVALQEQKQIYILPTVRVTNLLQSEIQVLVTEIDPGHQMGQKKIGNHAAIQCESTADLYVDPAIIYFTFIISEFNFRSKPVDTGDWIKKLNRQKKDVAWLDISLEFDEGKYFASLRLYRGHWGILEAAVFTAYTLKNDTEFPLFFSLPNQRPLSRDEVVKFGSSIPPKHGLVLQPRAKSSWIFKSNKLHVKLFEENAADKQFDLDALSGFTEISLITDDESGPVVHLMKFGVSLGSSLSKATVPSQIVTFVPRYLIVNESKQPLMVRQCDLEESTIRVSSGESAAMQLTEIISRKRQATIFDNFFRKHGNPNDATSIYIEFQPVGSALNWSGPVCIASLGRFFLKFKRMDHGQSSNQSAHNAHWEFAVIHVVQEGPTFFLRFQKPPTFNLPYRIENKLHQASITFYQKDSSESEILGSGSSTDYVWDDLRCPHTLAVHINDTRVFREINLDKVRSWKPLLKSRHNIGMVSPFSLVKKPKDKASTSYAESNIVDMAKVGYEVCADGPTRVLRICEYPGSTQQNFALHSSSKYRLRLSSFSIHFLQHVNQDSDERMEPPLLSPIIIARVVQTSIDLLSTNLQNYYMIRVQSLNVDEKWVGAPFAAVLRRNQLSSSDTDDCILRVAFIVLSSTSNVKQVKYASVLLQPITLNLDEETLMKVVPFWRTSLNDSKSPSRQFYFDHFEIHPIKVVASFLPGDSYPGYNSAQETLRTLLHSIIKVPAINNKSVELNGVLITHALITTRELFVKCLQHYSWYSMRAIYIAKGSPLLPPFFASIFDDLASSSLDVFFDPSSGLISLPGLTVGTFKLLSKCIDAKGFSGTKRYFGDLGKTIRAAGSNVLFAAVTEVSDSVLKGAEASGVNGLVTGFHQGILKLAMDPSILGHVFMEGGPDRKIKLDRSPGIDELYIEGYLQAMLDTVYKQEYLRVRVIEDQVILKNLPPNTSLTDEIMDRVKGFLVSKALLKGDSSTYHPLRQLRAGSDWKIGPTVLTLCEHLFVSFTIRILRKQTINFLGGIKLNLKLKPHENSNGEPPATTTEDKEAKRGSVWKWGLNKFVLSGMVAYIDGRLCRHIPHPIARRIVSGFLLSFLDNSDNNSNNSNNSNHR